MSERCLHLIGGKLVDSRSGEWFETRNPADGSLLAEVARGRAEDIDAAVRSADDAFLRWRRTDPVERGRILWRVADLLREHSDRLARIESLDNGKPLRLAKTDVEVSARYFEFYAGVADKLYGDSLPPANGIWVATVREPYGVTGHIIPWNVAMQQLARGVAPALAAGNTAVVKTAEVTPLSCLELARLALEAGVPPGVLNIVHGFGPEAGAPLATHERVRKVTFTGSVETGKIVARLAADRLVPITLELGGKSPNIIFADADLDQAVDGACKAILTNSGQICSAGTRLLVEDAVYDEIVERMKKRFAETTIGPGVDDCDIGPLVSTKQQQQVLGYIAAGVEEGAHLAAGGSAPTAARLADGCFVEPTLFTEVNNQMRIAREEIFGPVLTVLRFRDEGEAVHIANDSPFGLVAAVWTRDGAKAQRVALQLEAGQVYVNAYYAGGVEVPFGGYKLSGIGREKGIEALDYYTQTKAIIHTTGPLP